MKLNFERISENFQSSLKTRSISHCDFVEVVGNKVFMVEETVYIDKNLLDSEVYGY